MINSFYTFIEAIAYLTRYGKDFDFGPTEYSNQWEIVNHEEMEYTTFFTTDDNQQQVLRMLYMMRYDV